MNFRDDPIILLRCVLEEDAIVGVLSSGLCERIKEYIEERKHDGPMTSESAAETVASAMDIFFLRSSPEQLDEYASRTNPSRTREQVVREVNAASLSGFIGLVKCDACVGVGQTDGCSKCFYCFGTGKREKQFTLEDLHTALNDLSIEHARR